MKAEERDSTGDILLDAEVFLRAADDWCVGIDSGNLTGKDKMMAQYISSIAASLVVIARRSYEYDGR